MIFYFHDWLIIFILQIKQFRTYTEVFPLKYIGLPIEPNLYRTLVGVVELACGIVLMYGRDPWRNWAAFKLMVIMVGAGYTNFAVGDYNLIPVNVVIGGLLLYFMNNNRS